MKLPQLASIKTEGEARQLTIEYQNWVSKHELSYGELNKFQDYFVDLAYSFGLYDEFKENGII